MGGISFGIVYLLILIIPAVVLFFTVEMVFNVLYRNCRKFSRWFDELCDR